MILTRKLALGVAGAAAAAVLGTAGVAAGVTAATGDSTPAAAPASAAPPTGAPADGTKKRNRAGHPLRARALHGEWVVKGKDGRPVTVVSVRGQVTAVGPTSVTVKAEDGYTATFTAGADTEVKGGADTLADVEVGARGAVVGTRSGSTLTARAVLIRK